MLRYSPFIRGAAVMTCVVLLAAVIMRYVWTRESPRRRRAKRVLLATCSLLYGLALAELGLQLFFVESAGTGNTLAARRWHERYWHPVNSFGYRDVEHTPTDLAGKKRLVALGDSFVAGCGIDRAEERFPDRLGVMLGNDWEVINIARPGWNTAQEYQALAAYPYRFDVVVLAYYINDIDGAAAKHGFVRPPLQDAKPELLESWINRSNLINLAYSRWYAFRHPDTSRKYWDYLTTCFSSETVWPTHVDELRSIVDYCHNRDIPMAAMLIPNLLHVEESRAITGRVGKALGAVDVTTLDLTETLAGREPETLVVNALDAHANEALHREMADLLFPVVQRLAHGRRITRSTSAHGPGSALEVP